MKKSDILNDAALDILSSIEEGVHIVDENGFTLIYNNAMSEIEGLEENMVAGKHLMDVYPEWTKESSTILTVLNTGKPILNREQLYLNFKGKKITTINSTYPNYRDELLVGAVEISKNNTYVSHMSEKIVDLQQRLLKNKKKKNTIKSYSFDNLIGKNDEFSKSISVAKRASKTSSSVLIYGDTGTGKELFAQSIHYESKRKNCTFIAQNCAALPESLLESLLFGTTEGSFTGAVDRPGLFEQADGGTLFLDEINSMSMNLQAKLLRVLQESYVRRLGGDKEIPIDVRIISATNEYPKDLLENGTLRKDLYYRINVIPIYIPNLIERTDDIPVLVNYFIREYNKKLEKDVWMISDELMEAFMQYHWVGNIRELKNFIESSMNMLDQDEHVITINHMPAHVDGLLNKKNVNGFRDKSIKFIDLNSFIIEKEKEIIIEFLKINNSNVSRAATNLGLSRQNLQYKMKIYNIDKKLAK